jgi:hypothetical protein
VIRQGLLRALTLHVPHPWIATNAFAIGRIARHDFPRFWPDLVTQILANLRSAFQVEEGGQEQWRIENSLTGLAAVTKELSSIKIGLAVSGFRQVDDLGWYQPNRRLHLRYSGSWEKCINIVPSNGLSSCLRYLQEWTSVQRLSES